MFPSDVRGWLHRDEAAALQAAAHNQTVLEIGAYCGLSTIVLAFHAQIVHTVDPFDASATPFHEGGPSTLPEFLQNLERHRVANVITHIGRSENILPFLAQRFTFAFIDGAHDEASVRQDLELTIPLLLPGSRIAFHDYGPYWPEVSRVVDAWKADRHHEVTRELIIVQT